MLDDVSLTVRAGEFLALLGPNGSGKTTLLRVLTGLLEPDAGRVRLFGKAPDELGAARRRIGYVPQVGRVETGFPVSAAQVVMMGRYPVIGPGRFARRVDREAVRKALALLEIESLAQAPLVSLSGGQRQRVFLARALVNRPDLLLLDEPTGGLDAAFVERFYALLLQLREQGMTIVIVSHDVGVVSSFVDCVACLNHRLVAHGKPDMVLDEAVLREMYGKHAVFFEHAHNPHLIVPSHDD